LDSKWILFLEQRITLPRNLMISYKTIFRDLFTHVHIFANEKRSFSLRLSDAKQNLLSSIPLFSPLPFSLFLHARYSGSVSGYVHAIWKEEGLLFAILLEHSATKELVPFWVPLEQRLGHRTCFQLLSMCLDVRLDLRTVPNTCSIRLPEKGKWLMALYSGAVSKS